MAEAGLCTGSRCRGRLCRLHAARIFRCVGVASKSVSGWLHRWFRDGATCVLAWQRDVCAPSLSRDWWHEQLKENNNEMVPSRRVLRGCGRRDPVWKNVGSRRANGPWFGCVWFGCVWFGRVWFCFPFSGPPWAGVWGCVVSSTFGAVRGGFACGADWAQRCSVGLGRFGAGGRDGEIGDGVRVDDGVGFADIGVGGILTAGDRLEVCKSFEAGVFFKANRQVEGGPKAGFEGDHSGTGR